MTLRFAVALSLAITLAGCFPRQQPDKAEIVDLQRVAAYPVETAGGLDPSGLVMFQNELFTVSDKVDNTIYRIEFGPDFVRMVPHIQFEAPRYRDLDWEGISVDSAGNFHLVSEEFGRILIVTPEGEAHWATPDLRVKSHEIGLFTKENAGFEGLTLLSDNHWLGAVEREPRGLVEAVQDAESLEIIPSLQTNSPFMNSLSLMRIADYSGLDTAEGEVYAIFRNAHLVVHLENSADGWRETRGYSFRKIETDPKWAYVAQTFGQAEGLAINGRDVYIIIDNNRGPRQSNPDDCSPLLIHARFPGENP